jgi:hypothetical protein
MHILKNGYVFLTHINSPIIVHPETTLFDISMAFHTLGLEMHTVFIPEKPTIKMLVDELILSHKLRGCKAKPRRWP